MSKLRQLGLSFATFMTAMSAAAAASASDDADAWFARDKALHFGASALLAGGGYAAATGLTEQRWKAFAVGGGFALAAGAAKEGLDALGFGVPSWRDFAWDVAGTAVGLGLAYLVDSVVRSDEPQPAPVVSQSRAGVTVVRF